MADDSGDLFGTSSPAAPVAADAALPLAERMRPRTLEELVGQPQLLGPGRLLRRLVERREIASMILWGPPGVGKTTIARLLTKASGARFVEISATSSGVKQVRETARAAAARQRTESISTALFIDEIHRFNKTQQDALLPWVESGAIVLLGATTENPSFEIVAPLLSRCRVVRLEPLSPEDVQQLVLQALRTPQPRGLGGTGVTVADELVERIADAARGDARFALSTLELAARLAQRDGSPESIVAIGPEVLQEALQRPWLRHGREEHFDQISALQKSVRSSDPDAAVYWLARMLEAGEDPKYLARRLIRIASEDIGLAEPRALEMAVAALHAFEAVGLPEGALALAQVTIYLAVAPKSDAVTRAYAAASASVQDAGDLPVPLRLRNAPTRLLRQQGCGEGYEHAHDAVDAMVGMLCLPDALRETRFYTPSDRGVEARIAERLRQILERRRRLSSADPANEPPSR